MNSVYHLNKIFGEGNAMTTEKPPVNTDDLDVDGLLEERDRLNQMFNDKFQKVITVMFTDLKGSTAIAEAQGDMATRAMLKQHFDVVFPAVETNNGTVVKTMGDGTMSYYPSPQDAVRAGVAIQKGIDQLNLDKAFVHPIYIRVGIHTGKGIVEKTDIFGDVVNVASRFESIANSSEIYISEETYNGLADKSEIYCRFEKTTTLKGKSEPVNVYKAFWNPTEVEKDIEGVKPPVEETHSGMPLVAKAALFLVPIIIVIFLVVTQTDMLNFKSTDSKRTIQHSVKIPTTKD